jgi:hypothetical protein
VCCEVLGQVQQTSNERRLRRQGHPFRSRPISLLKATNEILRSTKIQVQLRCFIWWGCLSVRLFVWQAFLPVASMQQIVQTAFQRQLFNEAEMWWGQRRSQQAHDTLVLHQTGREIQKHLYLYGHDALASQNPGNIVVARQRRPRSHHFWQRFRFLKNKWIGMWSNRGGQQDEQKQAEPLSTKTVRPATPKP